MCSGPRIWIWSFELRVSPKPVFVSVFCNVGETIIGTQFRTRCGGKGANQAVAVAKLCSDKDEMRFVSVIGDDSNGEVIKKHLLSFGMNLENVIVEPNATTGVATICVDDSGENSIVVIAGANNQFTTERVVHPSCCLSGSSIRFRSLTPAKCLSFSRKSHSTRSRRFSHMASSMVGFMHVCDPQILSLS